MRKRFFLSFLTVLLLLSVSCLSSGETDNITATSEISISQGLDTMTGYAEDYVPTGNEMPTVFTTINWNTLFVQTAEELTEALTTASPGDKIVVAPGVYEGRFYLHVSGTKDKPIWIVAEDSSNMPILDGGNHNNNTVLAIGAKAFDVSYVYVLDIKITNARTGISVDNADYVTIDGVEAYNIGQAGIHVRDGSEYNIIKNCFIHDVGLYNSKYGEGIYIGSDNGKWSKYDPACDYTQVINNNLGPNVTAEHIDIKEGSSYSYVIGNTFDAAGMNDILNGGLSFIDFKGNNAVCAYNTGKQNGNELFENAFEINDKWEGWGRFNYIHNNTITFDEAYYIPEKIETTIEKFPLGSSGQPKFVDSTKGISRTQWIVECNDQSKYEGVPVGNTVYNNIRIPADDSRMYNSSERITEKELTTEEILSLGL